MNNLKPVETIEIVNAIDRMVDLKVAKATKQYFGQREKDELEQCRRTIGDGLRFHSASKGVVVGEQ